MKVRQVHFRELQQRQRRGHGLQAWPLVVSLPTLTATDRKALRAAARRERLAAQKHRALIRKGDLAGRRDVTTAPCVTDDGLAFVSIECGADHAALALFALQPATEGRGMMVVDHTAGAVVARGRDGAAALRAFARMLPPETLAST